MTIATAVNATAEASAAAGTAARITPAVLWQLLDALGDGLLLVAHDGTIALVNRRCAEMLGYRREELTGLPLEALVPPELRVPHQAFRTGYAEAPEARPMAERSRLAALRKDGATVPVEISLSPVPTASETFVLAVIRDATESRRRGDLADLARGVVAEKPQITRDLLDRVVGRLFQVGLESAGGLRAARRRAQGAPGRGAGPVGRRDPPDQELRLRLRRSGSVRDGVVVELSRHLERGSCGWWRRRPGAGWPGRGPGPAARAAAGRRRPASASCRRPPGPG